MWTAYHSFRTLSIVMIHKDGLMVTKTNFFSSFLKNWHIHIQKNRLYWVHKNCWELIRMRFPFLWFLGNKTINTFFFFFFSNSGNKPCPSSVWRNTPPWLFRMSAAVTLETHVGHASTASCQTQTMIQNQDTLHPRSPRSQDSVSMQMLAKTETRKIHKARLNKTVKSVCEW